MKRPKLLILITIWVCLTALIAFIGVAAIAVHAFPSVVGSLYFTRGTGLGILSILTIMALAYLGLSVAAGIGLVRAKEGGRFLAIIHASLSLLGIPLGTVIGILTLIYLNKPEIKEYFESARK